MGGQRDETARLKEKYGAKAIEAAQRLQPDNYLDMLEWRDQLDQHYTKLFLDYTYGGLYGRGVLDDRTRLLIFTGECVVLGEIEELETQIRSSLANGVAPREVLEVILQATIYGGYPKVDKAARLFRRILTELGRLEEITSTQLPLDGRNGERTLEKDRPAWRVSEDRFPRLEEMIRKYGWEGIGTGLRLQPHHHVRALGKYDRWDPQWLKMWLDFIYAGMYPRGILDDKTRVLIMVGECTVMDEIIQGENHMRCALMLGASPREVLEVLLQSTAIIGMPRPLHAANILQRILEDQDRVPQLVQTQPATPVR